MLFRCNVVWSLFTWQNPIYSVFCLSSFQVKPRFGYKLSHMVHPHVGPIHFLQCFSRAKKLLRTSSIFLECFLQDVRTITYYNFLLTLTWRAIRVPFARACIAKKEHILKKEIKTPKYLQRPKYYSDLDSYSGSNYVRSAFSSSSRVKTSSILFLESIFLFYVWK